MKSIKTVCRLLIVFALIIAFIPTTVLPVSALSTAGSQTAAPTASTITINGTVVSFDAYTIDGSNYFKLRDLAYALSRTKKQFEVGWNSANNSIIITSGKAYTAVGGEMATGSTSSKTATLCASAVYINGTKVDLTAYTIKGNNYFKLRDVAAALNFGVTYNNLTKAISIDTTIGYTADSNISADSVEKRIKTALINKTSYLFKISDEYTFMPGLIGFRTFTDEKGTTKYEQTIEWSQNSLKNGSSGYIIRIDEGKASMQDSTNYTCDLNILENNKGISLSITSVNNSNGKNQIIGTINGNILTASQDSSSAYYSPYTKSGFGSSVYGKYSVGLVEVPKVQWPPIPVILSYSINEDKSVVLTWKDNNPSENPVEYYEIYRKVDVEEEYTKVATVSNCTTWTDSSEEVSDSFRFSLEYIVVAYTKTGVKSPNSNYILYFPSNW